MKIRKILWMTIIIVVIISGKTAFADSCPHCGQGYGDPMPGDETRVYGIRRQHEAECATYYQSSSSPSYDSGGNSGYAPAPQRTRDNSWLIERQRKTLEEQRQIMIQLEGEEEARKLEEEKREREDFQKNKVELQSSLKTLKSTSSTSLKTSGFSSNLSLKGLKIKEVPLPSNIESRIIQDKLKLKATKYESPVKSEVVKEAVLESYKETKQGLADKIKNKMLELSLKPFPGATYVKSLYDKYKSMREEMQSLNVNIFQYAMKGIRDGVTRSASSELSDGGLSEEYEEGRKNIFNGTAIKARELLKKEID